MEINKALSNITVFLKKYRYVVLVLLIGIVLMMIPIPQKINNSDITHNGEIETSEEVEIGEALEGILSYLDGAGSVKVKVSFAKGKHTIYQTDSNTEQSQSDYTEKIETVLISRSDKSQSGLISRVDPPQCMGVIVMCQGADNSAVKLAIVDAVAKFTGLGADRISVLKMK